MFGHIDEYIQERMDGIPALALAVIKDGAIAYLRGYGVTGTEDYALPVTPDTLFCIGSTSKTLTGTVVMRLVERGLLDLDTPVTRYLSSLRFSKPGMGRLITLRHLLSHTSGLPSAYTDYGPRDPAGLEAFIREELSTYRFIAPPGRVFFYSNAGMDLAGYVAETVSGTYFPLLVRDEVFVPLAMKRSTYDRNVAITHPLALPHARNEDGDLRVTHRIADNTPGNPAGLAISTVRDLAHLAMMFVNGGRFHDQQFLSTAGVAEMHRPQVDLYNVFNDRKYGLTFFLRRYRGTHIVQHGGELMSYACRFVLLPDHRGAVVALTNWNENFRPLIDGAIDRVFGLDEEAQPPQPATPDRSRWSGYEGDYLNVEEGLVTIKVQDDRLTMQWMEEEPIALEAVEGGFYAAEDTSVAFLEGERGLAEYVIVDEQPYRRLPDRVQVEPSTESLQRFAGVYYTESAFEGKHYPREFRVVNGQLYAYRGDERVPCRALSENRFVSAWGLFEFEDESVRVYNSIVKKKG